MANKYNMKMLTGDKPKFPCPPFFHRWLKIDESEPCHTDFKRHKITLLKCKVCQKRKTTATGKQANSHEYVQFARECWDKHEINLFVNDQKNGGEAGE